MMPDFDLGGKDLRPIKQLYGAIEAAVRGQPVKKILLNGEDWETLSMLFDHDSQHELLDVPVVVDERLKPGDFGIEPVNAVD